MDRVDWHPGKHHQYHNELRKSSADVDDLCDICEEPLFVGMQRLQRTVDALLEGFAKANRVMVESFTQMTENFNRISEMMRNETG